MSKIIICTGIYPPAIGGPAQYAKEIAEEFRRQGHAVKVLTYVLERYLPSLVRHELFFWRTFFVILTMKMRGQDEFILALDTFSVAWPAVMAAKLLGRKIIIRTGGDFLWESYVERTGDMVLLRNFYKISRQKWNWKERIIFGITKWTLQNASAIVFSTEWQRDIFTPAYNLDLNKNFIVENFYGQKIAKTEEAIGRAEAIERSNVTSKIFIGGTRPLKWKNLETLKRAFSMAQNKRSDISLDLSTADYGNFLRKINNAYAVILASLGDISPNMILDAVRLNKPFILTQENGLTERLKDIAIFCDPEKPEDIADKITWLADEKNYLTQTAKVANFSFVHDWTDIAHEILNVAGQRR